ncbi:MAG: hypothetical protein LBN27_13560 [Prevotellaceae bacterium]|jgi:hypothetical protein|nr:hypothetical protein [Prevotellaceae bacterium]
MKKIFLLLLVAVLAAACEGPTGPPGRNGLDAERIIIPVTIFNTVWRESPPNESLYYQASVPVPALTPSIRDNGTILVYRDFGNGYQQILPFTRHKEKGNVRWTQTIDYEFTDGQINFYVTNSDFIADPPETMYFRVVLIW